MDPFIAFMELFGSDMFTQTILNLEEKVKMCECNMHGLTLKSTLKFCSPILSIKCLIIIYNAYKAYLVAIKITTPDTALVASKLATSCRTRYSWSVTSYTGGQVMM